MFYAISLASLAAHASPYIEVRPDWEVCESPTGSGAVAACSRIIAKGGLVPDKLAEAYRRRGLAYRYPEDGTKPEYEKGMADLNKARELGPKNPEIYINLGSASGYADEKLKFFHKAIELDPRNAIARDFAGRVFLYEKKDYASAVAYFKDAIHTNTDDPSGYVDLGNAYFDMRQYQQAVEAYSATLARFPKMSLVYQSRAAAYMRLKEYDKAFQDYRGGGPNSIHAYLGMCQADFKLKAYEDTIRDCNESDAHTLRSSSYAKPPIALIYAAYMRSAAFRSLGREIEAVKDTAFVAEWTRSHPELTAQLKALDPE
jgi:predicted Zn-dependent protease